MLIKQLNEIQTKLVAGKTNTNDFGKFKYRTAEGILESVKPLLNGCAIILDDELVFDGDKTYVKATATLMNDNGESISASAYACQDTHKGMSNEQASGTASSYARKYALCGLLAVDGNTDVDSLDNRDKNAEKKATKASEKKVVHLCGDCGCVVTDGKKNDGSVWSAEEIAEYTMRRFGEILCYDCANTRAKQERETEKKK